MAAQPRIDTTQPAAILPALQAFGAALHRAAAEERRAPARAVDPQAVAAPTQAIATTLPDAAPVDTSQPHWPDTMVAQIERLRDAHNEADTRIRLHPDALGRVDVALRRDGDAVQVTLSAAEPAARALLADAQPQLQALAEARGIRLSGADPSGGAAAQSGQGGAGGDPRQPAPTTPLRPLPRPVVDTTEADAPTDTRIA